MKPKAIGISGGIGSMLIGAKKAGFQIVGNFEERKDFFTGTFEHNFPKSFFVQQIDQHILSEFRGIDLIMAHPPCGMFSNLRNDKSHTLDSSADMMLRTLRAIKKTKPRFFVIDNLPKLLESEWNGKWWAKKFPQYDIYLEFIRNYNYGNIQKGRNRLFIIGARKGEEFWFTPGDFENNKGLRDVIGDLYKTKKKIANHNAHVLKEKCSKAFSLHKVGVRYTWEDAKNVFKNYKPGKSLEYHSRDGQIKSRFAFCKNDWEGPARTLVGKNALVHPKTCLPLSIRERLRIQGAPDSFVILGMRENKNGTWNHDRNLSATRQTGRFIPVEFCTYISKLIMNHIKGKTISKPGVRLGNISESMDREKTNYCKIHKYTVQYAACNNCWLKEKCKIKHKELPL